MKLRIQASIKKADGGKAFFVSLEEWKRAARSDYYGGPCTFEQVQKMVIAYDTDGCAAGSFDLETGKGYLDPAT
jgi:hypothetical protein